MDADMNFSQDSQSQYMEPGQKRQKATLEDLDMEKKNFFSQQICRNNILNEDFGVNMVLEALDNRDPIRAIKNNKKILNPQVVATLGFFHFLDYASAHNRFNKIKLEELTMRLVNKCRLLLPDICRTCMKIYHPDAVDTGAACFI